MFWLEQQSSQNIWIERAAMSEWSLQDAKNRFSAVVAAALAGEPQRVTRRGRPAVMVVAVEEYERLRHLERAKAPTFADLLLSIPQDGGEFERIELPSRPVDF
jgi:prevent-host-death family protein